MSEASRPIEEGDLHAYVDGRLDPARRAAVEQHLSQRPEDAERVAAYKAQRDALRAAFATRTEPLPPELSLARIMERWARRRPPRWLMAASVVVALGLGAASGWLLHAPPGTNRTRQAMLLLEQEALASHLVYSRDQRHPVEVSAAEEPHLRQWLSNRLNRTVAPPDLTALGYHLIGGRLLATERGGAAALFMYSDGQGQRVSVLLRPMAPDLHARAADITDKGVNGRAWITSGLGVAVTAALPGDQVAWIAEQVGDGLHKPG